jgi:histone-lysine N-methyltransferase SETMAR
MLYDDHAPGHIAISVNEVLTIKGIPLFPQPPYSPDLSPFDFFHFPKLKFHLKGLLFVTVDNIQRVVTDQLRELPHEDFQYCYR